MRLDAPPLFVATQSTLAQDYQPWMHIHIEKFDEVSRICRNNCKIVIKRILPYLMIRPTKLSRRAVRIEHICQPRPIWRPTPARYAHSAKSAGENRLAYLCTVGPNSALWGICNRKKIISSERTSA